MTGKRIVNYRNEWQVCEIAVVQEDAGPEHLSLPDDPVEHYQAWVYGRDRAVLCRVGQEESTYPLPSWEPTDFFRDRFPFAIDLRSEVSGFVEKVRRCNNAIAAFDVLLHAQTVDTTLTLRHVARIIRQQKGLDDFQQWFPEWSGRTGL